MPGPGVSLPAGYRLVHPRVRFHWSRFVHVAPTSTAVKVTLCGRVSPGDPADLAGLHHDLATGVYWYMLGPHSLCPRCAARIS